MTSNKRIDPNQPKHWHECAEYFDNESDDQDDDVNNDSEDPVMVEKDSGDESDASYVKSDGTSDEEPPRRRAKREQQLKQSEIKIFTARSGRQWTTEEPPKRKILQANVLRQQNGIGRAATGVQTIREVFQLLMTQDMVI
ncbi:unnamed protein product, partial [Rotaria magnacalcarata]